VATFDAELMVSKVGNGALLPVTGFLYSEGHQIVSRGVV
jgi:hypothetical protein